VRVAWDDRLGPRYDRVMYLTFSPDGQRLAYSAEQGEIWFMVVNHRDKGECYAHATPVFSPDSKHLAYGVWHGGKWFIVLDGRAGPGVRGGSLNGPLFSPDSQHVGYTVTDEEGTTAVVDGHRMPLPDKGRGSLDAILSPNLEHVACVVKKGDKEFVAFEGQAQPEFNDTWDVTFSPDGGRLAYLGRTAANGLSWWTEGSRRRLT